MKARLIKHQGSYTLLTSNGDITRVSHIDARDFLLNFSNDKYYSGNGFWDHDGVTMENYRGTTVAIVDDAGDLIIKDALLFKDIIIKGSNDFMTVPEFAELHGKSHAWVRRLCQQDRIPGAILIGNTYIIPSNASFPK